MFITCKLSAKISAQILAVIQLMQLRDIPEVFLKETCRNSSQTAEDERREPDARSQQRFMYLSARIFFI